MTITTIRSAPTDTGMCGTDAGYQRHRRQGEEACRPCLDATNLAKNGSRPLVRELRAALEAKPVPPVFGLGAGNDVPHAFVPLSISQCLVCWGWRDDPRHPVVGGPVVGR